MITKKYLESVMLVLLILCAIGVLVNFFLQDQVPVLLCTFFLEIILNYFSFYMHCPRRAPDMVRIVILLLLLLITFSVT